MKIFNKLSILVFASLFLINCEDEEKLNFQFDATTVGAVLSTIKVEESIINTYDIPNSILSVRLEFNDFKNHDTMEEVGVYLQFIDATPIDGQVYNVSEKLLRTLTLSDFPTVNNNGRPETLLTVSASEALDILGLQASDVTGSDVIIMRLELKLTDGRVFSSDNVGEDVAATSHLAPFRYSAPVACITSDALPGSYVIEMKDSYGDGWNGAAVRVTVDGVDTDYTLDSGDNGTTTFELPASGTISFVSGAYDEEVSYVISRNGETILTDGTSPKVGEKILSIVMNNKYFK